MTKILGRQKFSSKKNVVLNLPDDNFGKKMFTAKKNLGQFFFFFKCVKKNVVKNKLTKKKCRWQVAGGRWQVAVIRGPKCLGAVSKAGTAVSTAE